MKLWRVVVHGSGWGVMDGFGKMGNAEPFATRAEAVEFLVALQEVEAIEGAG